MSAYIVDNRVLFDVIMAIKSVYGGGSRYNSLQALKDKATKKPRSLFDDLVQLNEHSIIERYGKDHGMNGNHNIWNDNGFDVSNSGVVNKHQLLKSLDCYMYQCCEGDSMEDDLYVDLEHIKGQLARDIVRDAPQYEKAKW
tara:strand:+ start:313 stop:735 length:423 start_codon:yes stop_codon:yes gene_type:complete